MKNSIKKNLIVIGAVSAVFLSTASVFAATSAPATVRPMPASNQTTTSSTTSETSSSTTSGTSVTSSGTSASDETSVTGEGNYRATNGDDETDDTNVTRTVPTAIPAATTEAINVVSNTEQTSIDTKKYVSKGGMVGWLIVSIIINALISFWIGNRFHKLSQKDSHITAEIRALRRDVDEKFLQSVGGFSEQETDISNANDDYSMSADGITMPHRQPSERRTSAESDEAFKKWESQMNSSRARNQRRTSSVEGFDEFEQSVKRRKYQPTREEYEDAGAEEYAEEESTKSGISSVKSKAKEFLGDIFPFKED